MSDPIIPPAKCCTKCGEEKPYTEFHADRNKPDGRFYCCKKCRQSDAKKLAEQDRLSWPVGHKRCTQCGDIKPETYEFFSINRHVSSGLHAECRKCGSKRQKEQYAENPQPSKDRARKYAIENPEKVRRNGRNYTQANRAKINQQSREYSSRNRDLVNERNRVSKGKYHERVCSYNQQYIKENRALYRAAGHRYRARKRFLPDTLTTQQWERALEYFKGCCATCGRQLRDLFGTHTAAADHWIPVTSPDCLGTVAENMVPLCHGVGGCNNSKSAKDAKAWLIEKFGKRKALQVLDRINAYFEWAKQQE